VVGEITWGGGGCEAWAIIKDMTPAVDSSGKEFWSMDVDEWVYENPTGNENENKPPVKGHMLHSTKEKDDDGNLYLVWTFAGEDCWMIGKKEGHMGMKTEGDNRRLNLTDFFIGQDVLDDGRPPLMRTARDAFKEREELGLEKLVGPRSYLYSDAIMSNSANSLKVLRNTSPDEKYLLGSYRWIYSSADKHPWHPRESWDSGLALFRNPSGGSKITGRLRFWFDSGNAETWTTVGAISPSVDEEGKEIWSMTSRGWYGEVPQRGAFWSKILLMDGHQMRFTVEEDDAGNPFLEVMLCWGFKHDSRETPPTYSYLIGKKQSSRFGRLGFSAEEYARLAYRRQSRIMIDGRGEILEEYQRLYWHSLPNPMKDVDNSRNGIATREIYMHKSP
jgi:hypothetical protein